MSLDIVVKSLKPQMDGTEDERTIPKSVLAELSLRNNDSSSCEI